MSMRTLRQAAFVFVAICAASAAHAIPITFDFTGEVTSADPAINSFGLTVGDTIVGAAFIPDADLVGAQTYSPAQGGLELVFDIGSVTFTSTQDSGFPDFPTLDILDGVFVGLDFFVFDLDFLFSAFAGQWDATEFEPSANVAGTFSVAATSVPEPTTLALLAIGLIGLGLGRRRR